METLHLLRSAAELSLKRHQMLERALAAEVDTPVLLLIAERARSADIALHEVRRQYLAEVAH